VNLQFLGDALDHWKGSVFEGLKKAGALAGFHVDAMASDAKMWRPQDWILFSKLLRVELSQIISHKFYLTQARNQYFDEIPTGGDLFLDPDTGIQTNRVKEPEKYLRPTELRGLMEKDRSRVVVVYQHVRARHTRDRVCSVLSALRHKIESFSCTSYESGTVAMLFLSFNRERIAPINDYFGNLLGFHAKNRVGSWNW
jgi:hypothetical protein